MTHPKDEITSAITPPPASALPRKTNRLNWEELDNNKDKLLSFLNQDNPAKWWERKTPEMLHIAVLRFNESKHPNSKATLETIASHPSIKQYINQPHMGMKQTPLYAAVSSGNVEAVRILVKNNADPTIGDIRYNRTPLSQTNNPEIIKILSQSSKPEGKLEEPETPEGAVSPDQTKYLKIKKLPTNLPIDIMSKIKELGYINTKGNVNPQPFWEKLYEDIEAKDDLGRTALECAISRRKADLVKLLLDEGANQYLDLWGGHTILDKAVKGCPLNDNDARETLLVLLKHPSTEINKVNQYGSTILSRMISSVDPNSEMVQLLLDNNADPNICGKGKKTPLQIAQAKYDAAPANEKAKISNILTINKNDRKYQGVIKLPPHEVEKKIEEARKLIADKAKKDLEIIQLLRKYGATEDIRNVNDETQTQLEIPTGEDQSLQTPETQLEKPELLQPPVSEFESQNAQTKTTIEEEITKFFKAVQNGELPELGEDFDVNYQNTHGYTLLHYAVYYNNPHLANFISTYKPNLDIQNEFGETPLHLAAENGDLETVKLLKNKADFTIRDCQNNTPLNIAAIKQTQAAKKLDEAAKKLDEAEKKLDEAEKKLDEAAKKQCEAAQEQYEAAKKQCEAAQEQYEAVKKQCEAANKQYEADEAAKERYEAVVEYLWDHNRSNVTSRAPQLSDDDLLIVRKHIADLSSYSSDNNFNFLLKYDINVHCQQGYTILYVAARHGKSDLVLFLLERGVDPNFPSQYHNTALHTAVEANDKEMTELLLENGAKVDITNAFGDTALYRAVRNNNTDMVRLLIDKGAKVTEQNLKYITLSTNEKIGELLNTTYNSHTLSEKSQGEIQTILNAPSNSETKFNAPEGKLEEPLPQAPVSESEPKNAQARINELDKWKYSTLDRAVQQGNLQEVKKLLNEGALVHHVGRLKCYILYEAITNCSTLEVLDELLKYTKLDTQDLYGGTVLHWAVTLGNEKAVKILLDRGANPNLPNKSGKTSLQIAQEKDYEKIIQILRQHGATEENNDSNDETQLLSTQTELAIPQGNDQPIAERKLEEPETPEVNSSEHELQNAQSETTPEEKIAKIFQAVQDGELPELGADFNINYQNTKGNTLLHFAVEYKNPNLAHFIELYKPELNIKNHLGDTPLHFAVEYENPNLAHFISTYKPNLNIQNNLGDTPLHFAARKGHLGTVELLVKNNADPKIANFKGDPPLNLAAINRFEAVADYLSQMTYPNSVTNIVPNQELEPIAANPSPETFVAAQNTSTPTDKYEEQLPESQNQVGPSNHPQSQPNPPLYEAAKESDLQTVNNLLNSNVDVNARSTSMQNTALHIALRNKNVEIVKLLLEKEADVDLENKSGVTALHLAVYNNNVEMVKLVLEKSKNVNLINSFDGKTALHVAVYNNNVEMVKLLLEKKADVNLINSLDGKTALHLAVDNENVEIVQLLIAKGADVDIKNKDGKTALYLAVDNENVEIVQLLIAKGADVNTKNKHGYPVLHEAALITKDNEDKEDEDNEWVEDTEILLLLLEKGADVNIKYLLWNHGTTLHYAAEYGYIEVAKLLIQYNADLNTMNREDATALHVAVFHQKIDIARLLLEKGVDVNAKIGNIPADQLINRAISNEDTEMVRLLIEHGAEITKRNFDSGCRSGVPDNIKTLIKATYNAQHPDNAQHPAHSWFSIDIGGIFLWVKSWLSGGNENNTENSHNQYDAHSPMRPHDSEHSSEASTGWLNSIFSFFSNLWSPGSSDHHPEPNTSVVGDNHVPPVGEPHE